MAKANRLLEVQVAVWKLDKTYRKGKILVCYAGVAQW